MSNEQDNLSKFMTAKEVAAVLGVHHATVGHYCQAGELDAHKIGVAWCITRASVERMAARRQKATNGRTMTTKQAAAVLGITHKAAIHLCQQGAFDAERAGNLWRIAPESVTAYQQRGTKAEPVAKPVSKPRPRKAAKQQAREEPTPWQARPEFDWTASVRGQWESKLHAAIALKRGPGQ